MTKKPTITCKVCGGEHAGTICTKFSSVRIIDRTAKRPIALLAAPVTKPKPVTKPNGGRPKLHADAAARKRAQRERAKAKPPA